MTEISLRDLTIVKARELFNSGDLNSQKLTEMYLAEIAKKDSEINSLREVFADAIDQAKKADEIFIKKTAEYGTDEEGRKKLWAELPLLGIPVVMKDNILIEGRKAGASSKILENYVATYDSTVTVKLKTAGAVFLGRSNMDEFAMGGSTENSAYGVTKNPHDLKRVAGGSSGGSAAVVAMDGALVGIGSDTGGSIRQPASYCGVVGLKPTYGSVSRHGLMAMGSSLDVIGPITKNVEDAKIVFDVIKGKDIYDATSIDEKVGERAAEPKKLVIGIVPELMNMGGIDQAVLNNLKENIEKFRSAGYEIKEISLPNIKYSLAVYYVLMPAEVSSNMARFDGVKFGSKVDGANLLEDYLNTRGELLGKEVRRRIILGTYVLSSGYYDAYYNKANIVKNIIKKEFDEAFKQVDVILTPTAPSPAFVIGQNSDDPIKMYLEDVFTVTANLIGTPAISIPSGKVEAKDGENHVELPLGLQFIAPNQREDVLFEIGEEFEKINQK